MSIKTEIEAYTGDIDTPDITAQALQFAKDGVRYIYSIVLTNPEMGERLSANTDLNTASPTLTLTNVMSLDYVLRNDGVIDRPCTEGESSMAGAYSDPDSLHRATITSPVYYIKNNDLTIIPAPLDAQLGKVGSVTPDTTFTLTDDYSDLTGLLPELSLGVTLYAASMVLLTKMNAIGKPTDTNLTTIAGTASVDTEADRVDITKWFNIVGDYIQDEDVELASAYLSKINSYLQNYQMELTGDQSQYQWYESQYVKVSQSLAAFLEPYVGA
tara:strand:+ start:654 stop:1466 length:813 start_codon:yes stop_codon:yes gene_type:complete